MGLFSEDVVNDMKKQKQDAAEKKRESYESLPMTFCNCLDCVALGMLRHGDYFRYYCKKRKKLLDYEKDGGCMCGCFEAIKEMKNERLL